MIRKYFRRRPELEAMESKLLMSGVSAVHHPAAAALVAPVEKDMSSPLFGKLEGTFHEVDSASPKLVFSVKGTLSPGGKSTVTGFWTYGVQNGSGTMTVETKHGKIKADLSAASGNHFATESYSIKVGTGQFEGTTGAGDLTFEMIPSKGNGLPHGKISIDFLTTNE